jgi:hypothetical protein
MMKKTNFRKLRLGRLTIGVFICILMLTTSVATTLGNFINSDENNSNSLSYTFLFKEPVFKSIHQDSSEYTLIDIQGCMAVSSQAGEPQIPIKTITLLLPPKKTVSSINVVGNPVQIQPPINLIEKPVFPYQNSVPFGIDITHEFQINSNIYSSNNPYPSNTFSDYNIGYSHGYAILNFGLNPLQYTPSQGTIIFYPEITVTINLEDNDYINPLLQNNPEDEAWVENLVSNPEITDEYRSLDIPTFEYPGGLCSPGESYDYVIITTTYNGLDNWDIGGTLTYNWDSLMDKHESDDGLSCTLVTVQDIDACSDYQGSSPFNDQQAHIREFCKDAYEDWGTRYILIGADGESSYIPARDMDTTYETDIDADIYWSNLDSNFNADNDNNWGETGDSGFDLYSDLYIGRVTCDTPQDVSNWLTKSFYYADSTEDIYLDKAVFYGGDTGWNCQGDDFMDYSAVKGTDDWLGPNPQNDGPFPTWAGFQFGFETWNSEHDGNQFNISTKWTAEPLNPGWQGGSESAAINGLKTSINNNQVALISGIAHADPTMSLDVYSSSWESQYTNTKPFFIHDYGCHCGDFDDSDDGVLHSMLFHSNTELAFGCVYNTCYGWGNLECTNSSSAFQAKEFWAYFLDMENKSQDYGNWQLGKAHAFSKDRMASTIEPVEWDASYGTWRAIVQGCLLFGDPAQILKTPHPSAPPEKPTKPTGKTNVLWFKQYSYNSSTTEPDNDDIYYLYDWGDGNVSEWIGPYSSGEIVTASHEWTELRDYEVKVKAKDVWGASSSWSEPLVVTVTDNTPPEAPSIEGPTNVKPFFSYTYTINTTDADGDNVRFYIDWGEGESKWYGPYSSGESFSVEHKWMIGSHTMKVKARDTCSDESDWSYLEVSVPRNKALAFNFILQQFLERFPNAFPILKILFNKF